MLLHLHDYSDTQLHAAAAARLQQHTAACLQRHTASWLQLHTATFYTFMTTAAHSCTLLHDYSVTQLYVVAAAAPVWLPYIHTQLHAATAAWLHPHTAARCCYYMTASTHSCMLLQQLHLQDWTHTQLHAAAAAWLQLYAIALRFYGPAMVNMDRQP